MVDIPGIVLPNGGYKKLNQGEPVPVRVSIEGRVGLGDGSGQVQLYADVIYMDGDYLWGQTSVLGRASHVLRTASGVWCYLGR